MTELELKQLETKVNKAKELASNINRMKTVTETIENAPNKTTFGITYKGYGLYISRERFLDLLSGSITDYKEELEKL